MPASVSLSGVTERNKARVIPSNGERRQTLGFLPRIPGVDLAETVTSQGKAPAFPAVIVPRSRLPSRVPGAQAAAVLHPVWRPGFPVAGVRWMATICLSTCCNKSHRL